MLIPNRFTGRGRQLALNHRCLSALAAVAFFLMAGLPLSALASSPTPPSNGIAMPVKACRAWPRRFHWPGLGVLFHRYGR